MKIILAGGSNSTNLYQEHVKDHNLVKLYSILNEKNLINRWDVNHPLMVDSGAHSWNKETITPVGMKRGTKLKPAREFLDWYMNYIKENKDKPFIFVEFDVYGHLSLEEINESYDYVKSLNGKSKFIRVYHPTLDGGDLSILKKWIDEGQDYIGVGNDSTEILDEIFSITKDKVMVHGFAMTKPKLMAKYPFFSVDSTSPLSTVIFGRYSRPIMSFDERKDIIERSSIKCYDGDYDRLKRAVIEVMETEDLFTELWTKKGITWPELKF